MELIRPDTKIDFVSYVPQALIFSCVLILVGLGALIARGGPNYGIDFSGGTLVQVRFATPTDVTDIRNALSGKGLGSSTIQDLGEEFGGGLGSEAGESGGEFLIRTAITGDDAGDASKAVTDALRQEFGADSFVLQRAEMVGPRVGESLRSRAIWAVLSATLMMGMYIWARFELRFGIGAYAALAHDVFVTLGFLTLFNYELDLTVVAALLTVVGFSVNDTVIISDRIRENMRKVRRQPLGEIINRSINETLSRTILTTGTAVMVILALFFLGGNVIHGFAFTLLIGFLIGTYSSIFIASPIVLRFEANRPPRR
jgi:preprotein translocase subunit SecF